MIKDKIALDLGKTLRKLGLPVDKIHLEHPENWEHGDYASNIALTIFSKAKSQKTNASFKTPLDLAKLIVDNFPKTDYLKKIETASPGFINFWLSEDWLSKQMIEVLKKKEKFGRSQIGKGKRILLEHTSPNVIKMLHIGHLRNNILGMALANILKFLGYQVTLDCINNDRGIHICKAIWAYLVLGGPKKQSWRQALNQWFKNQSQWPNPEDKNLKPDHFVDQFYVLGVKAEAKTKRVKEEMRQILRAWEAGEKKVRAVWKKLTGWVYLGFQETYRRLGSHHDHNWYESQIYEEGRAIVMDGLKKGIFRKLADGAILTCLEKFGLPDTIIMRSDGTTMYHTQDLALTKHKRAKFPADLYIWDVGSEQKLYFKQLFAICEQLGIGKRSDYLHLAYGYVYLKGKGKMSSRKGTVVSADELLDKVHQKAKKIIETSAPELRKIKEEEKERVAEIVGLAALKYGLLKFGREKDIYFDIDESISLMGNSGPYLQYTYARAKSVLRKAKQTFRFGSESLLTPRVNLAELAILRTIYKFPEVVVEAGEKYAPNLICNFLFDLAQKFNLFYNQQRIIGSQNQDFRLALTAAVAQILQNGLHLLGIKTLEKM